MASESQADPFGGSVVMMPCTRPDRSYIHRLELKLAEVVVLADRYVEMRGDDESVDEEREAA